MDAPHPNYDHVHHVRAGQLPDAVRTDSRQVARGYDVGVAGRLSQAWVFFDHLEPAVAFGCACSVRCRQARHRFLRTAGLPLGRKTLADYQEQGPSLSGHPALVRSTFTTPPRSASPRC